METLDSGRENNYGYSAIQVPYFSGSYGPNCEYTFLSPRGSVGDQSLVMQQMEVKAGRFVQSPLLQPPIRLCIEMFVVQFKNIHINVLNHQQHHTDIIIWTPVVSDTSNVI